DTCAQQKRTTGTCYVETRANLCGVYARCFKAFLHACRARVRTNAPDSGTGLAHAQLRAIRCCRRRDHSTLQCWVRCAPGGNSPRNLLEGRGGGPMPPSSTTQAVSGLLVVPVER